LGSFRDSIRKGSTGIVAKFFSQKMHNVRRQVIKILWPAEYILVISYTTQQHSNNIIKFNTVLLLLLLQLNVVHYFIKIPHFRKRGFESRLCPLTAVKGLISICAHARKLILNWVKASVDLQLRAETEPLFETSSS